MPSSGLSSYIFSLARYLLAPLFPEVFLDTSYTFSRRNIYLLWTLYVERTLALEAIFLKPDLPSKTFAPQLLSLFLKNLSDNCKLFQLHHCQFPIKTRTKSRPDAVAARSQSRNSSSLFSYKPSMLTKKHITIDKRSQSCTPIHDQNSSLCKSFYNIFCSLNVFSLNVYKPYQQAYPLPNTRDVLAVVSERWISN